MSDKSDIMSANGHNYFWGGWPEMPWKKAGSVSDDKIKAVEVRAELRQIKTMADGSVNVVLNLPEDCMDAVKVLLDWLGLEVGAVIVNNAK